MTFNQLEYNKEYKKKHKKIVVSFEMNKDEADEFTELCKKHKITKIQVLRNGIQQLKEKKEN